MGLPMVGHKRSRDVFEQQSNGFSGSGTMIAPLAGMFSHITALPQSIAVDLTRDESQLLQQ